MTGLQSLDKRQLMGSGILVDALTWGTVSISSGALVLDLMIILPLFRMGKMERQLVRVHAWIVFGHFRTKSRKQYSVTTTGGTAAFCNNQFY